MKKENSQRGLKVYDACGTHVKTVSSRYKDVIEGYAFHNLSKKRLTAIEKFELELRIFLLELKENQPLVFDYIKDCNYKYVRKVKNFYGEIRNEIIFCNGVTVQCNEQLYRLYPNKKASQLCYLNY